jgi:hypothetical protein
LGLQVVVVKGKFYRKIEGMANGGSGKVKAKTHHGVVMTGREVANEDENEYSDPDTAAEQVPRVLFGC